MANQAVLQQRRTFMETFGVILSGNDKVMKVHLLQGWNLLSVQKLCVVCGHVMILERRASIDGYIWRCPIRPCRKTLRLRVDTFFEAWRYVDLGRLTHAIYLWSIKLIGVQISQATGINEKNISSLRQKLRACCTAALARNPIAITGGGGFVVQIDESMFHHRQRQHVGRVAHNPIWVFGMVDTQYTPAKGYIQVVPDRTRATLTNVINQRLAGNVTIHSDQWRGYMNLPLFVPNCVNHETVNHTANFIDPVTGAHTQNMESYWNKVKYDLKKMKGCRRNRLQSYLDEHMWREWYGGNDHFTSIINCINIDFPQ